MVFVQDVDAPGGVLDHCQDIRSGAVEQVYCEEIGGEDPGGEKKDETQTHKSRSSGISYRSCKPTISMDGLYGTLRQCAPAGQTRIKLRT